MLGGVGLLPAQGVLGTAPLSLRLCPMPATASYMSCRPSFNRSCPWAGPNLCLNPNPGEAAFAFAAADEAPADGSMVPPLTVSCQLERIATVGALLEPAPLHAYRVRECGLLEPGRLLEPCLLAACLIPPSEAFL